MSLNLRRLILPACALLTLAAWLPACGLITASVSLPEAFTHNAGMGFKGTIVDDAGNPVDDVLVTVKREYYLWHADASYPEFDTMTLMAGHSFDIPERRAHELTFTFHKAGYLDQTFIVALNGLEGASAWVAGENWPLNAPVRIVMQKGDRALPPLAWLVTEIDYTDPNVNPVLDLTKAMVPPADPSYGWARNQTMRNSRDAVANLTGNQSVPPHGLYAAIARQPTKTTGPERRVDPLDLNMPANLALKISDADAGFLTYTPLPGTSPLVQMSQAPESGYVPELMLSEKRLREMRDTKNTLVTERNEFFYFKANGKYGKGIVSWTKNNDDTGPLKLSLVLITQPDGSANLAMRLAP